MKPYRKQKISKSEFIRLREIGANLHKRLYTCYKRRIRIKRLNK